MGGERKGYKNFYLYKYLKTCTQMFIKAFIHSYEKVGTNVCQLMNEKDIGLFSNKGMNH